MFNHVGNSLSELPDPTTINGVRYYCTPSGRKLPSITSITSLKSRKSIAEWRKRVGAVEADRISKQGTTRGTTFDNAILLIDEAQNLNFHELDSIITRVGENSKIMFCGDVVQTDLVKQHEKNGIIDFMKILEDMEEFSSIEFGIDDIVRSGLVKSYLVSKMNLGL